MNRKHTGNKNASGCDKYVHYCFHAWKLHFLQPMTGEPIDLENIRTHMFD